MSDDNDLEPRVTRLEHQVARLYDQAALAVSDAGAARLLAAGADHEVSIVRAELRAHTQVLNALRETQLEQGRAITDLRHDVTSLQHDVTSLRHDVTSLRYDVTSVQQEIAGQGQALVSLDQKVTDGFAALHTGMEQLTALLTRESDSAQN